MFSGLPIFLALTRISIALYDTPRFPTKENNPDIKVMAHECQGVSSHRQFDHIQKIIS